MGSLGLPEILVVAVLALVVFGPERLPELARQAGKAMAKFRSEASRSVEELKRAAEIEDLDRELRGLRGEAQAIRESVSRPLAALEPRPDDLPPPTDPDAT